MKKSPKKKVIVIMLLSFLVLLSNFSLSTVLADDNPYEKHYQADLRDLNISLENYNVPRGLDTELKK